MRRTGIFRIIILVFCGAFLYLARPIPPEPAPPPKVYDPNIVAYDWENDRNITKAMADTMIFSGGKWLGKSTIQRHKRTAKYKNSEPRWIKPAGRDRIINSSPAALREWEIREKEKYERSKEHQLTEDDVRDIIESEKN